MRRTGRWWHMLLIALAVTGSTGCSMRDRLSRLFQKKERPTFAVRIADQGFTRRELETFFERRLNEFKKPDDGDGLKSHLLDAFIEERLLVREANRLNIEANPEALKALVSATRSGAAAADKEVESSLVDSLKVQQYLQDHLSRQVTVTTEECEAYYASHVGEFVVNDVAHVREILVGSLELAERIRARLVAARNKNFAELARQYSKGPNASEGGDLGQFQRGDLPEEFEKAIFPLAPGSVSKVVRSKYGYHLFMVEEKIKAHQQRFYEVKEQIREKLQLERERDIINREVTRLSREVPVEVYRDNLGFNYIGTRFQVR